MKVKSTKIHVKPNLKGGIKILYRSLEHWERYSISAFLAYLFIRVPDAIIRGNKISLKELGEVNSLILAIFASILVGLLIALKYVPKLAHFFDAFFIAILYASMLYFIAIIIYNGLSHGDIEWFMGLLTLIMLLLIFFDVKIQRREVQVGLKRDSEELFLEPPEGYNPT